MSHFSKKTFSFFFILTLSTSVFAQTKEKTPLVGVPYVVMVSFDGFRHDYVEKYNTPNFKEFIKQGAAAEMMLPSFPSKTFPNHYTLVTGLYPGNHGLVDNTFYDKGRDTFYSIRQREKVDAARRHPRHARCIACVHTVVVFCSVHLFAFPPGGLAVRWQDSITRAPVRPLTHSPGPFTRSLQTDVCVCV